VEETLLRPRRGRAAVPVFTRTWEHGAARGVALLVHGLHGHGAHDSNLWTAHTLLNAGYTVVAVDVEGHGRSGGLRGLLPSIVTDVAGDVAALLLRTHGRYPGKPLFLMGNSMGGLSAALSALALQHDGPGPSVLSGVVLQCPLIRPAREPAALLAVVARLLTRVAPHLPLFQQRGVAGSAARARLAADTLCYAGGMRVGTALALHDGARHLAARLGELRLPLLLQHGTADALVALRGSAELCAQAASPDKTLLTYDGATHNLLNEAPAVLHRVRADYLAWLDARVEASASSAAL
jgi:acylglycerol lipase